MGKLIYEGSTKVDFEDRLLAHLQMVIGAKLRRGEAFAFSWRDDPTIGDGRTTIWLHPQVSLVYKYYGSKRPALNRTWIDVLSHTANGSGGLYIVAEPTESSAPRILTDEMLH